jgi:hypothetical protein
VSSPSCSSSSSFSSSIRAATRIDVSKTMGVREEQFIRTPKRQVEKRPVEVEVEDEDDDENDMRLSH